LVLCPAQKRDDILDVGGFQELEAAELREGDVPSRQLDLKQRTTYSTCACSSAAAIRAGFSSDFFSEKSRFLSASVANLTVLRASKIGCVDR
jgi:hypothetical protein